MSVHGADDKDRAYKATKMREGWASYSLQDALKVLPKVHVLHHGYSQSAGGLRVYKVSVPDGISVGPPWVQGPAWASAVAGNMRTWEVGPWPQSRSPRRGICVPDILRTSFLDGPVTSVEYSPHVPLLRVTLRGGGVEEYLVSWRGYSRLCAGMPYEEYRRTYAPVRIR